MVILVKYQKWNASIMRPHDNAMNEKEIVVDSLSDLPVVGDVMMFLFESDGERGTFKVRSRYLIQTFLPDSDELQISVNVVLEEIESSSEYIKE